MQTDRRSFLKLSALGIAGAGIAIRAGKIFSVPLIVMPAVGGMTPEAFLRYATRVIDETFIVLARHLELYAVSVQTLDTKA